MVGRKFYTITLGLLICMTAASASASVLGVNDPGDRGCDAVLVEAFDGFNADEVSTIRGWPRRPSLV